MKFENDLDYVVFYALKMKSNSELFSQQKIFLESQLKASQSLFSKFGKKDFKKFAREYLSKRGLI